MNQVTMHYDLFELQFFDPDVYDALVLENGYSGNYSKEKNRILSRVALSRENTELVYEDPSNDIFGIYAHVGYHD